VTTPAVAPDLADECCAETVGDLIPAPDADVLAVAFKALADPTRVRLLHYLAYSDSGTACACHLPEALGISQPTLSFHMKKLHDAGLVTRDKRGRWVHWTVRAEALATVRDFLDLPDHEGMTCC
jgi:ArsR family transcriptional regulator